MVSNIGFFISSWSIGSIFFFLSTFASGGGSKLSIFTSKDGLRSSRLSFFLLFPSSSSFGFFIPISKGLITSFSSSFSSFSVSEKWSLTFSLLLSWPSFTSASGAGSSCRSSTNIGFFISSSGTGSFFLRPTLVSGEGSRLSIFTSKEGLRSSRLSFFFLFSSGLTSGLSLSMSYGSYEGFCSVSIVFFNPNDRSNLAKTSFLKS